MPKFDFSVKETTTFGGGSSYSIPDGWYVLKVVRLQNGVTSWGDQQVDLIWDVAEGDQADKCQENSWNDYAHMIHMPLSGSGAGKTSGVLHMLTNSNPGFKADDYFVKDDYAAFEGKVFGARLANEDSKKVNPRTGKPYRNTDVKAVCSADDARKRAAEQPAPQPEPQQAQVDDIAEDEIPF